MESAHFNFKLDPVLDADLIKWLRSCRNRDRSRNIREALYSYLKSNKNFSQSEPIKTTKELMKVAESKPGNQIEKLDSLINRII